jgi:hypothetical protein
MPLLDIVGVWGRSSNERGRAGIEIEAAPNIEDQTDSPYGPCFRPCHIWPACLV